MTELAYLTLAEASTHLRRKELSPVEYTQELLERIHNHDARFNTFLLQTPELACCGRPGWPKLTFRPATGVAPCTGFPMG